MSRVRTTTKVGSSGGGGSTTYNQFTAFFTKKGPASYATGGFVIDLSATFSSLTSLKVLPVKGSRGALPWGGIEVVLNSPAAGKATVLLRGCTYAKTTAIGSATSQPGGVSVAAASGSASSAEAAHTHTADHDHASFASAAATAGGAGVTDNILGPNATTHTHTLDLPNMAVTSGAGGSHSHTDNTLYDHLHVPTHSATQASVAEVANATDLSATVFAGRASGTRR